MGLSGARLIDRHGPTPSHMMVAILDVRSATSVPLSSDGSTIV